MEALVKIGSSQFLVKEGQELVVSRRKEVIGEKIKITDILLLKTDDKTLIGKPEVKDAWVEAEVKKHFKGAKVIVYKYIRRKGYQRKRGHRQCFTLLKITKIGGSNGQKTKKKAKTPNMAKEPAKAGDPKRKDRVVRKRTEDDKKETGNSEERKIRRQS